MTVNMAAQRPGDRITRTMRRRANFLLVSGAVTSVVLTGVCACVCQFDNRGPCHRSYRSESFKTAQWLLNVPPALTLRISTVSCAWRGSCWYTFPFAAGTTHDVHTVKMLFILPCKDNRKFITHDHPSHVTASTVCSWYSIMCARMIMIIKDYSWTQLIRTLGIRVGLALQVNLPRILQN